jgi:hypothetical protein
VGWPVEAAGATEVWACVREARAWRNKEGAWESRGQRLL